MKILINCSNLKVGGGLQVAHSFINELKCLKEHQYIVVASSTLLKQIKRTDYPQCITFIEYSIKPSLMKAITGKDAVLKKIEEKYKIDKVFTVFGPSYWKPKTKHICGFAKAQYLYINSPFFKKESSLVLLKLRIKSFFHLYSLKNTTNIFITELWDVSEKLKELFPNKQIYTVTNTYNQVFEEKISIDTSTLPLFDGVTLLTVSANYPHKNLTIIQEVVRYLKEKYSDFNFRFVLTLNQEDLKIKDRTVLDNIVFLGKVEINQCPALYSQADLMFLPTLLECFSASYPEAMKMNVPILTSDLPFARSICNKAAEYFEPLDVADIGDKIYNLSLNKSRQKELIEQGLKQLHNFDSSESRAEKYLDIILNS